MSGKCVNLLLILKCKGQHQSVPVEGQPETTPAG